MVHLWNRYAQKLRGIILLQFEIANFRFGYMRTLKPLICMISGILDVSEPQNQYYFFGDPKILQQIQEAPKAFFNILFL